MGIQKYNSSLFNDPLSSSYKIDLPPYKSRPYCHKEMFTLHKRIIKVKRIIGRIRIKYFAFVIPMLICLTSFSQQPSHFFIGEQEFANSQVYSLLISSENKLYVTTNYGLSIYQNGTFITVESTSAQHGSSLFSLSENTIESL